MKLNVADRLQAKSYLPTEADFATVKIIRDLEESLALSEEESKEIEMKISVQDGQIRANWNAEKAKKVIKDIKMGEIATKIVVDKLEELNKEEKLTQADISLYEKFIENKK